MSARYIIEWKPEDVIRWLEAVGYGEVRKNHGCVCRDALGGETDAFASPPHAPPHAREYAKFEVSGETLLKLDDDSLQEMVPDLKKKIGRRKKPGAREAAPRFRRGASTTRSNGSASTTFWT